MEIKIIIAGFIALFVAVGHLAIGIKLYLVPMIKSNTEIVPKATMHCVFHYISVFLFLSAILLLGAGFEIIPVSDNDLIIKFIGLNYILFTIVQIIFSIKNNVPKPLTTMFQWMMFLPIGILSII